jgi:hypothetical protein
MKKLIVAAFSLGTVFFSATVTAGTPSNTAISINVNEDERQPVKAEELPEAVKKTLAGDDYKGFAITEATLVKSADATSHYEVSLAKDKETKLVKIDKDGKILK